MATIKLTEKSVAALEAPTKSGKQELHWDFELKGFGVLASGVSDAKTFVAQAKVKGTGLTRRVTIGRCDRLKVSEARDKAREVLAKLDLGEDPKTRASKITLKEALTEYIKAKPSLKSADGLRDEIERHLRDWLEKPIRDVSPDAIETRHVKIAEDIRTSGRGSGHATANRVMRNFRAIYNHFADRDDEMPNNPVGRLKRVWFKVRRRTRLVKAEDLPSFYSAINGLENEVVADYIRFLLFSGMRRREAASLRWDQVDFAAKTITIAAEDNKGDAEFKLPMSDLVLNLLIARRAIGKTKYIFPANSESGHLEEPKDAFEEIANATGIVVSCHDLRRTFETLAESCDLSAYALKALINHRLPSDTTGGYIILSTERLRDAAQKVAHKVRELCHIEKPEGENVTPMKTA